MAGLLVTGGSGFVGRNLFPKLVAGGHHCFALTRRQMHSVDGVDWIHNADATRKTVASVVGANRIDTLVHLAGRINGRQEELYRDNVEFTRDVLSGFDDAGTSVRVVYLSSVSAIDRLGDYGAAKRAAEDVIAEWPSVTNWRILRSSLIYGPHESTNVGKLVHAVRRWPAVPVIGPRTVYLQPLYVEDLCDTLVEAVNGRGRQNATYVVAGPRQESMLDMIRTIADCVGRHPPLLPVPLAPVQWSIRLAGRLFPWLDLPLQQISNLSNHPPWNSSDAERDLGFAPRTFAEGAKSYLRPV